MIRLATALTVVRSRDMTVDRRGFERQDAKTPRREPEEELDRVAYATIGAAIEVHRHLGPGFLEAVYEEAMFHELRLRGIDAEARYEFRSTTKEFRSPSMFSTSWSKASW